VNWQHFKTFLWLRWRLGANQIRKAGPINFAILIILLFFGALASAALFFIALAVGLATLSSASPFVVMAVWDGIVVGFLFFWMIGLLVELQRSEFLSMDKFLHLPVSGTGVFLINYFGSLINLPMIAFLPGMLGLSIALVFTKGPAMLLMFPLLAAFLLVVTGVTHQFRGWLASMMANKRRRRNVVAIFVVVFVLVAQAPNVVNMYVQRWSREHFTQNTGQEMIAEMTQVNRDQAENKINFEEANKRRDQIMKDSAARTKEKSDQEWAQFKNIVTTINMAAPPLWPAWSIGEMCDGIVWPSLLVTGAMALIGTGSLWRSYRTTLRMYRGQFTSGQARPAPVKPGGKVEKASVAWLEKDLPWQSVQTSAIAAASLRSLIRAPEAKMMLLSPIILALVFGSMFFANPITPPEFLRPLMFTGAIAFMFVMMIQLLGNQFGFDRSGFRTFVLCAAPRRDILLGKNLAFAPIVLVLCSLALIALECVFPMRVDHFLAMLPQMVSMYLLFCMLANWLSILNPMPIAAGSLKPVNPKASSILLQMAFLLFLPVILGPTVLPFGIEFLLQELGVPSYLPIGLVLAVALLVGVVYLYRTMLNWQGDALQAREQKILETVTTKSE
jgi:hypothetical protein